MAKDILLDSTGDLSIRNGDFEVGESVIQETGLILQSTRGDWRQFPLLGPGLTRLMRGISNGKAIALAKLHLAMDSKDYNELKDLINIRTVEK